MGKREIKIISYDCPGCGATVQIDADQTEAKCEYCGVSFKIEEEKQQPASNTNVVNPISGAIASTVKTIGKIYIGIIAVIGVIVLIAIISAITNLNSDSVSNSTTVQIIEADPFENLEVKLDDAAPWGTISYVRGKVDGYSVEYSVDKSKKLSNGDIVTIKAEPRDGYEWTRDSYEYTVEGLDTVITDISMLSEEDIELITSVAKEEIQKKWDEVFDDSDETITAESINLQINLYKTYLNISDSDYYSPYLDSNSVLVAFETTYTIDSKDYTLYQFATLDDVIIEPDNSMVADFNTIWCNGYLNLGDYGFNHYCGISAYESVLKMESDMKRTDFTLIK
ncbi:MAG: hypothetical protein MJ153_01925 [Clostridia bacterium]|nr:hypothetical protein [Clostridia bacterium]